MLDSEPGSPGKPPVELRLEDEPGEEGELLGIDGIPPGEDDDEAVGIEGDDDEDEDDEEELGIEGADDDDEDEEDDGLGIEGAEEEEDEDDELGIDGMPLLLELCCVDSQPANISASAEAPIKAATRKEWRLAC